MPPSKESDRALIVIDMTVDRVAAVPGALDLVRYVQGELKYFRERGRPVLFVCTGEGAQVIPELTPRTGERIVVKKHLSAFFGTPLSELLPPDQVKRLTLTGLETNTSILLTAADALARGYHVVVPEPCVCAVDQKDHDYALRQIRDVWPKAAPVPSSGEPPEPTNPGARGAPATTTAPSSGQ